jgi:hypothetical protein
MTELHTGIQSADALVLNGRKLEETEDESGHR